MITTHSGTVSDMAKPRIVSIAPLLALPGQKIVINGSGFAPGIVVKFGELSNPATFRSPTQVSTIIPNLPPGTYFLTVDRDGVKSNAVLVAIDSNSTAVSPPPPVKPQTVPIIGIVCADSATVGSIVTIKGSGFTPEASVLFGSVPATSVVVVDPSKIQAKIPSVGIGNLTLKVKTAAGEDSEPFRVLPPVPNPTFRTVGDRMEYWDMATNSWISWEPKAADSMPQDVLMAMVGSLGAIAIEQSQRISELEDRVMALDSMQLSLDLAIAILKAQGSSLSLIS